MISRLNEVYLVCLDFENGNETGGIDCMGDIRGKENQPIIRMSDLTMVSSNLSTGFGIGATIPTGQIEEASRKAAVEQARHMQEQVEQAEQRTRQETEKVSNRSVWQQADSAVVQPTFKLVPTVTPLSTVIFDTSTQNISMAQATQADGMSHTDSSSHHADRKTMLLLDGMLSNAVRSGRKYVNIPHDVRVSCNDVRLCLGKIMESDWMAEAMSLRTGEVTIIGSIIGNPHAIRVRLEYEESDVGRHQDEVAEVALEAQRLATDARDACGMDDGRVARYVHDHIVRTCSYAIEIERVCDDRSPGSEPHDNGGRYYTAWDALCGHRCVCEGYARAFKMVMLLCGIPCCLVSSEEMSHMWDMVYVDGAWYHVDVTYDDPIYVNALTGMQRNGNNRVIKRTNLLRSDDAIANTGHSSWHRDVGGFLTDKPTPKAPYDYRHGATDENEWH